MSSNNRTIPSLDEIRETTLAVFRCDPCRWQSLACQASLAGDKDLINVAPTGSGKTLTFWMPLLFRKDGIQIVVTPLNILGTQNEEDLAKVNVQAVAVHAETATPKLFQDIGEGQYRAIVVNPEELMKDGGGFERLWDIDSFTSRIISIIWDEAHCISIWKSFRQDYKHAHRLRYVLPHTCFHLASATFPDEMRREVMTTLQIRANQCTVIQRSNDRPNVYLDVRPIQYPLSSFKDLDFLVPPTTEQAAGDPLTKFLIFFDDIDECVRAAEHLRARLHPGEQEKIRWFHAQMSAEFREANLTAFKGPALYGLCCTDSFGMGVNIADVRIVVQWRLPRDLNTLWQCFGRAARNPALWAVAILLVEARYFDEEKEKVKQRAEKRVNAEKRKAAQ
ncbi:P-loop containing nucleoside triphosphate hydrolase protein, partial [Fomitopsis serialis]|uniref:P-loop containing nucleoside triphosphate hydrolase protein n=1 Tax=Fomitopsis serialis TaxID=139415 RepID=UPI0020075C03